MKKVVEAVIYDKSGKMVFPWVLSTKMVKDFAGIKRIAELESDVFAQVKLDSAIVDAMKVYPYNADFDYIIIYNDYADTVEKHYIR